MCVLVGSEGGPQEPAEYKEPKSADQRLLLSPAGGQGDSENVSSAKPVSECWDLLFSQAREQIVCTRRCEEAGGPDMVL